MECLTQIKQPILSSSSSGSNVQCLARQAMPAMMDLVKGQGAEALAGLAGRATTGQSSPSRIGCEEQVCIICKQP